MAEPHRATARVLDLLEYLAAAPEGCTLTELSQALDAPKSSLFPIVHTLEQRHYLQCDPQSGRYCTGVGAYVLGAGFPAERGLDLIAKVMAATVDRCQETCQLGILEGSSVLYIEKADSPQAIRMISYVGKRLPANSTALGKSLLSGLTDEAVAALFSGGLPRLTEHTVADLDALLSQLAAIRATGLAAEREESAPQLGCWAVPLRRQGTVFAALSVTAPLFRMTEDKESLVCQSLRAAQAEIEQLAEARNFTLI